MILRCHIQLSLELKGEIVFKISSQVEEAEKKKKLKQEDVMRTEHFDIAISFFTWEKKCDKDGALLCHPTHLAWIFSYVNVNFSPQHEASLTFPQWAV